MNPTIDNIVDFIQPRSGKLPLAKWGREQVKILILEAARDGKLQIAVEEDKGITGVCIFEPCNTRGEFLGEQIWCSTRTAWRVFLDYLVKTYPNVKEIVGFRQRTRRFVKFNVQTLIKIYGK